jgi:hypothetical protein
MMQSADPLLISDYEYSRRRCCSGRPDILRVARWAKGAVSAVPGKLFATIVAAAVRAARIKNIDGEWFSLHQVPRYFGYTRDGSSGK